MTNVLILTEDMDFATLVEKLDDVATELIANNKEPLARLMLGADLATKHNIQHESTIMSVAGPVKVSVMD